MTQDWVIKSGEQVVVIADGTIYGAYENEALCREEWDRVTDHEWKMLRLHRMVDFSDDGRGRAVSADLLDLPISDGSNQ